MLTCLQRCNDDVTTHLRPRLGVLAADLRDYHSTLEITVFFTMHFVLILFPLYHLYRETFPVLVRFLIIGFDMLLEPLTVTTSVECACSLV